MDIIRAVALAKEGNNEGITFLYENTYQKSYYIALKYLKDEHLAQDVLQDSYLKAFQSLNQLEDSSKFEAWLGRIVATRSLNELKKKNPVLFSETETEDEGDISDTFEDDRVDTCPELAIDQQETSRLIREMMADLSDEQRMCITMFYMEEMSVKEIAEILGVSENTVKSRLNYGRNKIKDKVLELEKKGTKLYGLLPIVFFCALFKKEALACEVAVPAASSVLSGVGAAKGATASVSSVASATSTAAAGATKAGVVIGGTTISIKGVIAGVAAAVVLAGGIGTGVYLNNNDSDSSKKTSDESVVVMNDSNEELLELSEDLELPEEGTEIQSEIDAADVSESEAELVDEMSEETVDANIDSSEEGIIADSQFAYIAGRYKSDKGNTISISLSTEYDGEYPDGAIEGSAEDINFGYMYLEPTSVNVYDIKKNWQDANGSGYVLTGCDGGDTVRLYKDGKLIETFTLIQHFES